MNKKYKILIFIAIACVMIISIVAFYNYFKSLNNNTNPTLNLDVISEYLEIKISENAKIEYIDTHDSFLGDGETLMEIRDDNLLAKIKSSPNWKINSDEYTSKIINLKEDISKRHNEVSKVQNYYWIFKNFYYDKNKLQYVEQIESIGSRYLFGIYDIDNNLLYYYHWDS